jgi:hypothetical protein
MMAIKPEIPQRPGVRLALVSSKKHLFLAGKTRREVREQLCYHLAAVTAGPQDAGHL